METQDKAEDLMLSGLGSQMLFDTSMAIISAPVRAGAGKVKKALHRDGKRTEGGIRVMLSVRIWARTSWFN